MARCGRLGSSALSAARRQSLASDVCIDKEFEVSIGLFDKVDADRVRLVASRSTSPSMPVIQNDDRVWFDDAIKLDQLCNDVSAGQGKGHSVLLLSHFEATLARLAALLRQKGIHYERFSSLNPGELCTSSPGKVWLGSARVLQPTHEMSSPIRGAPLDIIVAEHHPIQSRDQGVIDAAAKLACEAQLCFYFSLDDPVMKHFGTASVKALFERLGIEKSECISHHLVTTAIRTAQENIESKVGKDVPTHSVEDWFKYNLPEKKEY
jgi:preprotein translocase subunit SecA